MQVRARGAHRVAEQQHAGEPPDHHRPDGDHERVDRDREGRARLPDAAQVDRGEQGDRHDGEEHLVLGDERDQRADVRRRRRDRHRDGQRVVDQQGAGHGQAGVAPEVDRRDLVVTPTRRVGVHVLPVARDHREQHDDDREPDPRRERVRRHPGHRQREEDLLRCIGHRRHGVRGEDRKRDPLRQQGVGEPVAALRAPDQDALHRDGELGHGGSRSALLRGAVTRSACAIACVTDREGSARVRRGDGVRARRLVAQREPRAARARGRGHRQGCAGVPPAGSGLPGTPGRRAGLPPRGARRGRRGAGGGVRGGLQRRQLQHHLRPGGAGDVRHRAGRRPDLRREAGRGVRAAGHPDGGHRAVEHGPAHAHAAARRCGLGVARTERHGRDPPAAPARGLGGPADARARAGGRLPGGVHRAVRQRRAAGTRDRGAARGHRLRGGGLGDGQRRDGGGRGPAAGGVTGARGDRGGGGGGPLHRAGAGGERAPGDAHRARARPTSSPRRSRPPSGCTPTPASSPRWRRPAWRAATS